MVVAKNDEAHRRLAKQFSGREVHKTYIALVHGWPKQDRGTIQSAISRHSQKRTRMTTKGFGGREAVTHYAVKRKLDSPYGKFALIEVKIETGRTHQIRVHMSSLGHPVVGDALYGAPGELRSQSNKRRSAGMPATLALDRNFLHSAALELTHPRTKGLLKFSRPVTEGTGESAGKPGKCPGGRSAAGTWPVRARDRFRSGPQAIIEEINSKQIALMKSRIFLLLVVFLSLAGPLLGQTPPASVPAERIARGNQRSA